MTSNILNADNALLLIIDIQEKLLPAQGKPEKMEKNIGILALAANILNIPTIVSEQYPKGLGPTVASIKEKLPMDAKYFEKTAFSCVQEEGFLELLKSYNRKQIIVCGMETHICVHQTVNDLLKEGFEVHVIQDAVSSRDKYEYKRGIERMGSDGAVLTCLETALFEMLRSAKHPQFKVIQALIK